MPFSVESVLLEGAISTIYEVVILQLMYLNKCEQDLPCFIFGRGGLALGSPL